MYKILDMHETMERLYKVAKDNAGIDGQSALAKRLNQSPQTLNNWEVRGMSKAGILQAAKEFFVSANWLETGEDDVALFSRSPPQDRPLNLIDLEHDSDFVAIRRAEFHLSAGIIGFSVEYINGDKAPIVFRKDWLKKRGYEAQNLVAVDVKGNSMETSLYDGDLVVVNTLDTVEQEGETYAINYEGELVIKRLKRERGEWWLVSDNQDKRRYPDKRCDETTFLIGKIVSKQSERI